MALSLFQDFGLGWDPDTPPVDWVEGVAIIVAIFIVVCVFQLPQRLRTLTPVSKVIVGSLNDWQKERQFRILNDKKEERGVKVVRSSVERVMISGSKVLKGYGKYVVIAVGQKSFNGRIMMGTSFHILFQFLDADNFHSFGSSPGRSRPYSVTGEANRPG